MSARTTNEYCQYGLPYATAVDMRTMALFGFLWVSGCDATAKQELPVEARSRFTKLSLKHERGFGVPQPLFQVLLVQFRRRPCSVAALYCRTRVA
ncbi:MAG: hypothetical protein ACYTE0_06380 [Planctomycetota bacterium]